MAEDMSEFQKSLDGDDLTEGEMVALTLAVRGYLRELGLRMDDAKGKWTGNQLSTYLVVLGQQAEDLRRAARKLGVELAPAS